MKRKYHHYLKWEDYQAGMWRTVSADEKKQYLQRAIEFTGNAELYGQWMLRVIIDWPIACEQNLSDIHMNREAWIGHAACCMAIGCPEDVTRAAWASLTEQQRDEANAKARFAIELWEQEYERKNLEVC